MLARANNLTHITAVVACDKQWSIAKNGQIPWHIADDLKHFKKTTMGQIVIMGRKTYETLPENLRPLPGRITVVLSTNKFFVADYSNPPAETSHHIRDSYGLPEALSYLETKGYTKGREIFIAGGAQIYEQAFELKIVDRVLMTLVHAVYRGDKYFPGLPGFWNKKVLQRNPVFDIIEYTRIEEEAGMLYGQHEADQHYWKPIEEVSSKDA